MYHDAYHNYVNSNILCSEEASDSDTCYLIYRYMIIIVRTMYGQT